MATPDPSSPPPAGTPEDPVEAINRLISSVARGRRATIGRHTVYDVHVDTWIVDRARNALGAIPSSPGVEPSQPEGGEKFCNRCQRQHFKNAVGDQCGPFCEGTVMSSSPSCGTLSPEYAEIAAKAVADVWVMQTDDDPEPNAATLAWRALRAIAEGGSCGTLGLDEDKLNELVNALGGHCFNSADLSGVVTQRDRDAVLALLAKLRGGGDR